MALDPITAPRRRPTSPRRRYRGNACRAPTEPTERAARHEPGHRVGDRRGHGARRRRAGARRPSCGPGRSSTIGRPGWRRTWTRPGVGPDAKVACYLYNGPEYLESTFAAFKVRAVPDQRQLPLPGGRARVPARQLRRRGGGVRRRVRRAPRPRPSRRCRRCAPGCASERTDEHPVPDWAVGLRGRARHDRADAPDRPFAATTSGSSTRAGPPACPRASCGRTAT